MTAREWITVALFVLGMVATVSSFLIRRLLRHVDQHGTDLAGVRVALGGYVKRETHDVANAETVALMERMRAEASAREGRLLEAIERNRSDTASEIRSLRGEFSGIHSRIDRLKDTQGASRRT